MGAGEDAARGPGHGVPRGAEHAGSENAAPETSLTERPAPGPVVPGIVVLGAGGQLGAALLAELATHSAPVVALGRAELDLNATDEDCATALRTAIEIGRAHV